MNCEDVCTRENARNTVRRLIWSYFADRPALIVGYVLLSLFYPIRVLAVPYYMGKLTSALRNMADPATRNWDDLRKGMLIIIAFWVVAWALQIGRGLFEAEVSPAFQTYVRGGAIKTIAEAYRRNYRELEAGDVNVKLFQLPHAAFWVVKAIVNSILPVMLTLFIGFFLFYKVTPWMGLVFAVFVALVILMYFVVTITMMNTFMTSGEQLDQLHESFDDFITNMLSLFVSDTVNIKIDELECENNKVQKTWRKMHQQKTAFRAATTFLKYMFVLSMIAVIVWRLLKGDPLEVAAALFVTLTVDGVIYTSVIDYIDMLHEMGDLRKTELFFNRVAQNELPAPCHDRLDKHVDSGQILYRNVTVHYSGRDDPSLVGANVTIRNGDRVLITGHIGSGKTTLTKLLAGLHPYTGSLVLGGDRDASPPRVGYEVSSLSAAELIEAVTYVPQSPRLFNTTILENILYGFENQHIDPNDIQALIHWLNIPNFPSLDTMAGKSGSSLSGGQRTIVYLIRGFLRKTPIVVLDEPTASLDNRTRSAVVTVINTLFRATTNDPPAAIQRLIGRPTDRTLLIISHDTDVDWQTTRRLLISQGHVVSVISKS